MRKIAQIAVITAFLLTFCAHFLSAQVLKIDITNACLFPGDLITEDLYVLDSTASISKMIGEILGKTGLPRSFKTVHTNVPGVAAVITRDTGYLLYNNEFFYETRQQKNVGYGVLARAIWHLSVASGHTCSARNRMREESSADEFMGRALHQLNFPLEAALSVADYPGYGYKSTPAERKKHIEKGWQRHDAFLQSQEKPGFLGNVATVKNLPLPLFQLPAPECAAQRVLESAQIGAPKKLGDVNTVLRKALDAKGYDQCSYYCLPNGFALVTQLEQCKMDGTSLPGFDRWKDYPVPEQFEDVWGYLKSLVLPQTSRFRFFVFVVHDQPITFKPDAPIKDAKEALGWLKRGGSDLPQVIADIPYSTAHKVTMLVYEVTGKGSAGTTDKKCPAGSPLEHLSKSGLNSQLILASQSPKSSAPPKPKPKTPARH